MIYLVQTAPQNSVAELAFPKRVNGQATVKRAHQGNMTPCSQELAVVEFVLKECWVLIELSQFGVLQQLVVILSFPLNFLVRCIYSLYLTSKP